MGMMKRLANAVPNRNKNRSLDMSQRSLASQHFINNRNNYTLEGSGLPANFGLNASGRNASGLFINPPTPPDHTGFAPRYRLKWEDPKNPPQLPPPPPQ